MAGKHRTGRASSFPAGVLIGTGTGMALLLLLTALCAKLISMEALREESFGYGIMAALLISSFTGAYTACERVKRRKLAVCGSVWAATLFCLLGMTALFFGGQYQGIGVTALLLAGGSGAATLLQNQDRKYRKSHSKRMA